MITKLLTPHYVNEDPGHSESPMSPHPYHSAYTQSPGAILRQPMFAFAPRILPPVNKVQGPPRLYG